MKLQKIMAGAWKLARKGQQRFGGKVNEYLSEALKWAWAMYKKELAKKGGDIAMIAPWFIRKEFGHESMVNQIAKSPLYIKKRTKKANLIEMHVIHNGEVIDTTTFWAPKSVCI